MDPGDDEGAVGGISELDTGRGQGAIRTSGRIVQALSRPSGSDPDTYGRRGAGASDRQAERGPGLKADAFDGRGSERPDGYVGTDRSEGDSEPD